MPTEHAAETSTSLQKEELAACGVRLVAAVDGRPRRDVVEQGIAVLGRKAGPTRPAVGQILISNAKAVEEETFEGEISVIRRRIEKAVQLPAIFGFYVCSLSRRSIIYNGIMLAEQVAEFCPDLTDDRFASAFAIYHRRCCTKTFPQWWLAQPVRMLARNGEINMLKGSLTWMRGHDIRMVSACLGALAEAIKPIV